MEFEQTLQDHASASQRQLAEQLEVPRSTLPHWLTRQDAIDASPAVVAFFESPDGVAFLHRLVLAAHCVMTLLGPCGIRLVCVLLELTGLHRFVAASYGPQQHVAVALEEAVVAFGQEEGPRLAEGMAPQKITVCQDETFHPETCLVAIEPVAHCILLEQYTANRKAETWTSAMRDAIGEMPREVIQSTSDDGRGILHHVKDALGAHHSPEVFHVQHELVKGTRVALASQTRRAEQALEPAAKEESAQRAQQEAYRHRPHGPGRPPAFDTRIRQAQAQVGEARKRLEAAQAHQERASKAVHGISEAYHPYDLETGAARSAEEVSALLDASFAALGDVTAEAALPERCLRRTQKAKRVVVEMVATIAFFWLTVRAKVEALALAPAVEQAVYAHVIPAIYLELVAKKAKRAEQRHTLRKRAETLRTTLGARDGPWCSLSQEECALIAQVAATCAQLFQRSSSCVEGRNGQLALRHHSLHRISNRKLAALTTVHNYWVKRHDETTAAERFFGAKPRDLFAWVLNRVDLPGRPAQKRSQPKTSTSLFQAVV